MGNQFRRRVGLWLGLLTLAVGMFMFYEVSSKAQPQGLMVDSGRLRSHLQTLAAERYTNIALARTRTYLIKELQSYGYEPSTQTFGSGDSVGTNLSVIRPGTQTPEQKILVGAHYDSVAGSPGADDNGSAVVTALEIARLFADYPTHKTLQVVFFDQEELQPEGAGLLGSNAFVNDAANLDGLAGAVILEMLGYACYETGCQTYPPGLEQQDLPSTGDFIGVIGDTDHPDLLATFATETETKPATASDSSLKAVTLPVPIGVLPFMPDLFRSDHAPFWLKGIGAVMVSDTANFRNPNYHQASDTVDTLDLMFLEQTANYIVDRVTGLLQNN
ncbi:M28 family peptidase [Adonisia turfae]|uniref:Peptidase M28 n=1 Tax=Adonisia turfae CCMR0081 TaxID=2292702 RepID=A0A6M0RH52_9CYAN|nr:M28 family peptidase [Adonisia turfae]NEZ55597.1 peptidase M28 [Adonisia turfae CCMR0081]